MSGLLPMEVGRFLILAR